MVCLYVLRPGWRGLKGWKGGEFMAVQWRTETSTGNLTECYELHVRSAVEEQRLALGFGRDQVFFNTDLVGQASTTYNASVSFVWLQLAVTTARSQISFWLFVENVEQNHASAFASFFDELVLE